jgi:hypothetical protein
MEAVLGVFLYSYLYLKLAKILCLSFFIIFLIVLLFICAYKAWTVSFLLYPVFCLQLGEEGRTGSAWIQGCCGGSVGREQEGEMPQTMYT